MVKYKRSPVRESFGGAWSECFAERSGLFCFLPHPVKGRADEIEGGQQVAIFRLIQQGEKLVADVFIDDDCAVQHEQQALLFCVHSAHLTVKRRTVAVLV